MSGTIYIDLISVFYLCANFIIEPIKIKIYTFF